MICGGTLPGSRRIAARWLAIWLAILAGAALAATVATARADDVTLGEEHQMDFSDQQTFLLTEDALRGDGILFDTTPNNQSIVTLWSDINLPVGIIASLAGNLPRYRYEVQIVPEGSGRSKIVVNVRGQNVTEAQLVEYKASVKLHLFDQIDQLARAYPPQEDTPTAGGINFALLPHEDLKGLALRATGNADNWQIIARDNGLKSPTDVVPFQTIWVRNGLAKQVSGSTTGSSAE